MPKKISKEDEKKFIDAFVEGATAGNATATAKDMGYKSPRTMGAYLKNKYSDEIRKRNEDRITSASVSAISVLNDLMINSEQDSVKFNSAKLVMELGGYSSQSINLNVEKGQNKSDEELIQELQVLATKIPGLNNKLLGIKEETQEDLGDTHDNGSTMDENRVIN
jgi:hypothetical protein